MKNKKILVLVILFISFFLTGCDNYKDGNYGEQILGLIIVMVILI